MMNQANEIQIGIDPAVPDTESETVKFRPTGWKKHHRWQWGWQKWRAIVALVDICWPRNP